MKSIPSNELINNSESLEMSMKDEEYGEVEEVAEYIDKDSDYGSQNASSIS